MRKIIVAEFITLDGVMQAQGGAEEDNEDGFMYGGWTWPYWHVDIGKHFFQMMEHSDALLLGRKTWQIHGTAFEPMPDNGSFGAVMNAVSKYDVSTTLKTTKAWRNSTLIKGNITEEVCRLKHLQDKGILIDGSSQLVHTLEENNRVDEYALHVYPLVLGSGKRLFLDKTYVKLKLIESQALPTGVVFQRYLTSGTNSHV